MNSIFFLPQTNSLRHAGGSRRSIRIVLVLGLALLLGRAGLRADTPWTLAVEMAAEVDESAPRIVLHWKPDPNDRIYGSDYFPAYTIYRRQLSDNGWTELGMGDAVNHLYEDRQVTLGTPYEYKVVKEFNHGIKYTGYGYLRSGIGVPATESRGTVLLLVDRAVGNDLADPVRILKSDLIGDGWKVTLVGDLGRDNTPEDMRSRIQREFQQDRTLRTVLLLGHFPIVYAGRSNPDGHAERKMPADAFYGDLDGQWGGPDRDGVYLASQTQIPSAVELEVGRVDFAGMPDTLAILRTTEAELLRGYLQKDHAYRQAVRQPAHRALLGDGFGDLGGEAPAVVGYRNFGGLVGIEPDRLVVSSPQPGLRWFTRLIRDDFRWVYGSGAGIGPPYSGMVGLGNEGENGILTYFDFYANPPKGTFYLLLGSWLPDWSSDDNILRAALIGGDGLASTWAGRPYLYFHGMGMGDTIGQGIRLSQNNDGIFYQTPALRYARAFHIALLGDPTLRQDYVAPPGAVHAGRDGGRVVVTWTASPDRDVIGYYVSRSTTADGPFAGHLGTLTTGTTFVDNDPGSTPHYMVRAVKLETTASGSYYNPSQGAFDGAPETPAPAAPVQIELPPQPEPPAPPPTVPTVTTPPPAPPAPPSRTTVVPAVVAPFWRRY